jgi:hypothetical protein
MEWLKLLYKSACAWAVLMGIQIALASLKNLVLI